MKIFLEVYECRYFYETKLIQRKVDSIPGNKVEAEKIRMLVSSSHKEIKIRWKSRSTTSKNAEGSGRKKLLTQFSKFW